MQEQPCDPVERADERRKPLAKAMPRKTAAASSDCVNTATSNRVSCPRQTITPSEAHMSPNTIMSTRTSNRRDGLADRAKPTTRPSLMASESKLAGPTTRGLA
jgi:hypothetical protein